MIFSNKFDLFWATTLLSHYAEYQGVNESRSF